MVFPYLQDAPTLRYGWMPSCTPSYYCACDTSFSVDHALSCPNGGFPSIRHNEVRDIAAELLSEVHHDVEVRPHLQPLSDEKTESCQHSGWHMFRYCYECFWGGCYEKCDTDIRVFNPLAPPNSGTTLQVCYRKHEAAKKRAYESQICEGQHSSFILLFWRNGP